MTMTYVGAVDVEPPYGCVEEAWVHSAGWTLSRDGSRLYVANGLSDDMTVIDVASAKALKTIPVGRVPYAVLIDD